MTNETLYKKALQQIMLACAEGQRPGHLSNIAEQALEAAAPIVEADGMVEAVAYQKPVDYWEGYGYIDRSCHIELRKMVNHLENLLDEVPEGPLYASQPAPVSVVLLLEWSEISDPTEECRYTHVTAKTAIGTYSIEWKAHKQFDDRTLFLDGDHVSSGHDLAEAKAKAQEHHSARVIACLDKPKEPTQ